MATTCDLERRKRRPRGCQPKFYHMMHQRIQSSGAPVDRPGHQSSCLIALPGQCCLTRQPTQFGHAMDAERRERIANEAAVSLARCSSDAFQPRRQDMHHPHISAQALCQMVGLIPRLRPGRLARSKAESVPIAVEHRQQPPRFTLRQRRMPPQRGCRGDTGSTPLPRLPRFPRPTQQPRKTAQKMSQCRVIHAPTSWGHPGLHNPGLPPLCPLGGIYSCRFPLILLPRRGIEPPTFALRMQGTIWTCVDWLGLCWNCWDFWVYCWTRFDGFGLGWTGIAPRFAPMGGFAPTVGRAGRDCRAASWRSRLVVL